MFETIELCEDVIEVLKGRGCADGDDSGWMNLNDE
jgi:hypothetical protein